MGQTRPALAQQQGPPHVRAPLQCMRPSRCTCLGARASTYASGSAIVLARAHSRALRALEAPAVPGECNPPSCRRASRPSAGPRPRSGNRTSGCVAQCSDLAFPRDRRGTAGLAPACRTSPTASTRRSPLGMIDASALGEPRPPARRAALAPLGLADVAARPLGRQARDRASRPVGTEHRARRAHDRRTRCKRGDRGLGFLPRRASTAARSARRRRRAAASGRALPARPTGHRSSPAGAREWP